jgi:hypothetical protein
MYHQIIYTLKALFPLCSSIFTANPKRHASPHQLTRLRIAAGRQRFCLLFLLCALIIVTLYAQPFMVIFIAILIATALGFVVEIICIAAASPTRAANLLLLRCLLQ